MNNQNVQTIVMTKTKSSTAVITGAIGFMLGVPAVLCATVCAGICAGIAATPAAMVAADPTLASDQTMVDAANANAAVVGTMALPLMVFIVFWLLGFILCFFGKSSHSKATGILTILCGIGMGIPTVITFNILGMAAAMLYVISGGSAIGNASRPNE